MKRLAMGMCLSFLFGAICYPNIYMYLIGVAVLIGFCIWKAYDKKWFILLLFMCFFGMCRMMLYSQFLEQLPREVFSIEGKLIDCRILENSTQWTIKVRKMNNTDSEKMHKIKVYGSEKISNGTNIININGLQLGDSVHLKGEWVSLEEPRNPGAFDQKAYGYARRIFYKGKIAEIVSIDRPKISLYRMRANLLNHLDEMLSVYLTSEERGLLETMLFADNRLLDEDQKAWFTQAGLAHLLAISGAHIALFAWFLYKGIFYIWPSRKATYTITFAILFFYGFVAGGGVSVMRAIVMMMIALSSPLIRKQYDGLTALLFTATLFVVMNPAALKDISLMLSFGAVLGMLVLYPNLEKQMNPNKGLVSSSLLLTYSATLFTLPVIVYYFGKWPTYSFVANLALVPFFTCMMCLSILMVISSVLYAPIALFVSGSIHYGYFLMIEFCRILSELPMSTWVAGSWPLWLITLFCCLLVGHCWFMKKKALVTHWHMHLLFMVVFMVITLFAHQLGTYTLKITCLDVDQGDCSVVQYMNKTFLIDGGGITWQKPDKNTGRNIVIPALTTYGISKLDGIFISHSDFDHIYGIIEIARELPVGFIAFGDAYENYEDALTLQLKEIASEHQIPIIYLHNKQQVQIKDLTIQVLIPDYISDIQVNNNRSMNLMIYKEQFSMLFTGDLQAEGEAQLLSENAYSPVTILKVPHHGSKTSSTQAFLAATKPQCVIISCGVNNLFGHPAKEVVNRYQDMNCQILKTPETGAVEITYKSGQNYTIRNYLKKE